MTLKLYFISLMRDERSGPFDAVAKTVLRVLSRAYEFAIRFVDWQYRSGLRRVHKVNTPVISVGNITLGGTGKTPFTIYLADHFLNTGRKPVVLIRGYGSDEYRMLRDELPDVPILVGRDRVKNARAAVKKGIDAIILDDGFQHRRIGRDLNILLLDSAQPFGNGLLFPSGMLRENVSSLKRADIVVLTKSDGIDAGRRQALMKRLDHLAPGIPVAVSRHKPMFFTDVTGRAYSTDHLKGKRICLVSGIADPGYFERVVKGLGGVAAARIDFADHHDYAQNDIDRIQARCSSDDIDAIIVTQKDYVKMRVLDISRIEEKLFILHIVIEITGGKEKIIAGLDRYISC